MPLQKMTTNHAIVLTSCANKREAERIAERLVADGAAACVSIVDKSTSVYRWKGKIEKSTEFMLLIKTRADLTDRVEGTIKGFSSFDCPEVIVLPIMAGSAEYLGWIDDSTAQ